MTKLYFKNYDGIVHHTFELSSDEIKTQKKFLNKFGYSKGKSLENLQNAEYVIK